MKWILPAAEGFRWFPYRRRRDHSPLKTNGWQERGGGHGGLWYPHDSTFREGLRAPCTLKNWPAPGKLDGALPANPSGPLTAVLSTYLIKIGLLFALRRTTKCRFRQSSKDCISTGKILRGQFETSSVRISG